MPMIPWARDVLISHSLYIREVGLLLQVQDKTRRRDRERQLQLLIISTQGELFSRHLDSFLQEMAP